jgi:hypothetical protein
MLVETDETEVRTAVCGLLAGLGERDPAGSARSSKSQWGSAASCRGLIEGVRFAYAFIRRRVFRAYSPPTVVHPDGLRRLSVPGHVLPRPHS